MGSPDCALFRIGYYRRQNVTVFAGSSQLAGKNIAGAGIIGPAINNLDRRVPGKIVNEDTLDKVEEPGFSNFNSLRFQHRQTDTSAAVTVKVEPLWFFVGKCL
jgi:hypothetical protein